MIEVYIGLGSNLQDSIYQVRCAVAAIKALEQIEVMNTSSLYQTPPWGKTDQPAFINAILKIKTTYSAIELLYKLQEIEKAQGKCITVKWGPRVIDCDLLLYGEERIHSPTLIVPHPDMKCRGFVLLPLMEISPDLILPSQEKIADLLKQCDCSNIIKIARIE